MNDRKEILAGANLPAEAKGWGLRIIGTTPNADGWVDCRAIGREDKSPSCSFNVKTGTYKDHKTGESLGFFDLAAALGRFSNWRAARDYYSGNDTPPPQRNGQPKASKAKAPDNSFATARDALGVLEKGLGKHAARWTYHDSQGEPVGLVARWDGPEGKTIRPISRVGDGWAIKAMPEPRPLYGLPELAEAETVVICEGEKATDAAINLGLVATCSSGGSKAATKTDWGPLADKRVVVLPDNDSPGEAYAEDVAKLATAAGAASVKIVRLPGLPEAGDLADIDISPEEIERLIEAAEPWQPDPPPAPIARYKTFPVDCLPNPFGAFVREGAAALGCDAAFLALPVLSVLAAAIGSTRRLRLKGDWHAPCIVWTASVGDSGTLKSPALRLATEPINRIQGRAFATLADDQREYEIRLALYERRMKEWKTGKASLEDPPEKPAPPEPERILIRDTTVEAVAPILQSNLRGVLQSRDELSGLFGSFDQYKGGKSGADEAFYLSAFNGEPATVDRKGNKGPLHIPQTFISITGGIQPGVLRRALGREHFESGLAARFLFASPPRRKKRWTEADIDPATKADYSETVERLLALEGETDPDGNTAPVLLRLSPDAKREFLEHYNRNGAELADLQGDLAAAWSKLEETPARLAIVLHEAQGGGGEVSGETMRAAITLAEWFKGETRRLYGLFSESNDDRNRRELIELIERKGGRITARGLTRASRKYQPAEVAEVALGELVKAGLGYWEIVKTATNQRREFVLADGVDVDTFAQNPGKNGNPSTSTLSTSTETPEPIDATKWEEITL